jgi:hypothetical protein
MGWRGGYPDHSEGKSMATIQEIEERIHALWAKGDARTLDESVELGRLLTALHTEMPPGDFYTHVLEVLHIPTRAAQQFMQQYRESQGTSWHPSHDSYAWIYMEKSNNHQSSMPATTADLSALKTEIIAAVKDSVQGLATQETVSVVMEAVAETKESVSDLKGLMKEMLEDLTATHEDVRYVRTTVTMLAQSDAAHEAAIESLRKRLERVERKVGSAMYSTIQEGVQI